MKHFKHYITSAFCTFLKPFPCSCCQFSNVKNLIAGRLHGLAASNDLPGLSENGSCTLPFWLDRYPSWFPTPLSHVVVCLNESASIYLSFTSLALNLRVSPVDKPISYSSSNQSCPDLFLLESRTFTFLITDYPSSINT